MLNLGNWLLAIVIILMLVELVRRYKNYEQGSRPPTLVNDRPAAGGDALPADVFTVNFVRLAGLSKDKARECEEIVRTVLATRGLTEDALQHGHRELWRVDLPDGAYTQLPGDPPGPAALRRVQNGIVYDVQPRSGRLIPASKPRMLPGCVTAAVSVPPPVVEGDERGRG